MIGDKVKELRKLLGMTQKDLADKLELKSQTTIAAIESNKNKPSNELLSKMSDLFKVSTDFLLEKVELDGGYLCLLFSVKLNEKMKEENLTVKELSDKLNISVKALNIIINAQLDEHTFFEYPIVAEYIGLTEEDADCLMSYSFDMLESPKRPREVLKPTYVKVAYAMNDFLSIPIVGAVKADLPILAAENVEGYIPLPLSIVGNHMYYFALKIKGDSMNLELKEGDMIVVEKTGIIDNGEIGVVLINDNEITVNKVVHNQNMITLIPMSSNPIHTPTMYDMEKDKVKILGKVKHAIKSY
jgi:repressor LexA